MYKKVFAKVDIGCCIRAAPTHPMARTASFGIPTETMQISARAGPLTAACKFFGGALRLLQTCSGHGEHSATLPLNLVDMLPFPHDCDPTVHDSHTTYPSNCFSIVLPFYFQCSLYERGRLRRTEALPTLLYLLR